MEFASNKYIWNGLKEYILVCKIKWIINSIWDCTDWPEPIWIKVNGWWQILPQHQRTYLTGPESASIEIPPFQTQIFLVKVPLNVSVVKLYLLHKKQILKKLWSQTRKGGFQFNFDSGSLRHVLWCCGSSSYQPFTFIQIGSGHNLGWIYYITTQS